MFFTACSKELSQHDSSTSGVGGSTARFTIVDNILYTVNNSSLISFDISNASAPKQVKTTDIGFGIETIFPYKNNLFIGAQTGMYIYDISNPDNPQKLSLYEHIYSCDPVVVQDTLAYVTLHSQDSWCGRWSNELHIINISNLRKPELLNTYNMENPLGLGVDGDYLFICDNTLKVYDISNKKALVLKQEFSINANDVIPYNNLLLVIGDKTLNQYDYSKDKLTLLSTLY